jgi:hypothetical protein
VRKRYAKEKLQEAAAAAIDAQEDASEMADAEDDEDDDADDRSSSDEEGTDDQYEKESVGSDVQATLGREEEEAGEEGKEDCDDMHDSEQSNPTTTYDADDESNDDDAEECVTESQDIRAVGPRVNEFGDGAVLGSRFIPSHKDAPYASLTASLVLEDPRNLVTTDDGEEHWCTINTSHGVATSESASAFEAGYDLARGRVDCPPLLVDILSIDGDSAVPGRFWDGQVCALREKWKMSEEEIARIPRLRKSPDLAHVSKNFNSAVYAEFEHPPKVGKDEFGWKSHHSRFMTGCVRDAAAKAVVKIRVLQASGPHWKVEHKDAIYKIESEFMKKVRFLPFHLLDDHSKCDPDVCRIKAGTEEKHQYIKRMRKRNNRWNVTDFNKEGRPEESNAFDFVTPTAANKKFADTIFAIIYHYFARITPKAEGTGSNTIEWTFGQHASLTQGKRLKHEPAHHTTILDIITLCDLLSEDQWKIEMNAAFGVRSSSRANKWLKKEVAKKKKRRWKKGEPRGFWRVMAAQVQARREVSDPRFANTRVKNATVYGASAFPAAGSTVQRRLHASNRTPVDGSCTDCGKRGHTGACHTSTAPFLTY